MKGSDFMKKTLKVIAGIGAIVTAGVFGKKAYDKYAIDKIEKESDEINDIIGEFTEDEMKIIEGKDKE